MKRIVILVTVAILWLLTTGRALAQQQPQPQPGPQQQRLPQTQTEARPTGSVYQRRDSWYEFLLKQFNPGNFDYGQWIEQHRQAFQEARLRNPYFGYSFGMTVALLLMTGVCTKLWIDHRRAMWVTAEMMTDIYNHDQYSREIARQAIEKYNNHIERCNRAVEAAQQGMAASGAGLEHEEVRVELQKTTGELERVSKEWTTLQEELQRKAATIIDLSFRLDGLSKRSAGNGAAVPPLNLNGADPEVIKLINELQEQLDAERQKNRQLQDA
jgi:hypothetical protein